jgi:predicted membrane-bound spermidine synthase
VRLAILSVVLFLSGISALIFETLWLRLSGLAFGNSIWAAAMILSSFMTGLALGTGIAASAKFRTRPLKLYAALEIAVAVFGCTIVFALPVVGEVLRPLFQALWNHQSILLALRVLFSFVILLIPTTAMGLTLPVIMEDRQLASTHFGKTIGILYGFNTIGAVVGALIGELFLVKAFGLWGTSLVAGLLNCTAAVIALVLAKGDGKLTASPTEDTARRFRFEVNHQLPWRLLIVSFGAGCALLALEVIWFRFLRLYVASSATAFSVMLAVVLAGIGLGGIFSGALAKKLRHSALPILLIIAAILTLFCYVFFPVPKLAANEKNFYLESWSQIALISFALMFPVAFLSGILFPTITARVQENVGSRMNSIGITTLFNTAGAAIGPLLAGFLFLPQFGFQTSLVVCAIVYALLCFISGKLTASPTSRGAMISLVATFAALLVFFPRHRDEVHLANARKLYESEEQHLVKKIEGETGTWQLLRRDLFGQPYYYRLMTDGFSMSATNPPNQRYMRLFAYLPLTLHPQPQKALLIAFGCGVTANALTQDVDLQHIDVVDISKEAFALADDYRGSYSNSLRDRRVSAIVQDGRFFLQASPERYDIITGEPPPPKVLGSVNLYTEQFFKLISDRLNDGGIATFWLPIYQLSVAEAKSILRAFHDAFPNTIIWSSSDEEWIMMGIKGAPQKIDNRQFRKFWDYTNTRDDLARIGVEVPEQLATLFVMDGDEIDRIASDAKPLTDFYPKRLGDVTAVDPAIHEFTNGYMQSDDAARRFRSSRLVQQTLPDEMINAQLDPFFVIREIRYRAGLTETNWLAELDMHLRGSRLREPVFECLDSNAFRIALAKKAADDLHPPPLDVLPDLIADALARRDYHEAIQLLENKRSRTALSRDDIYLLTYLYCLNGEVGNAESTAKLTLTTAGPSGGGQDRQRPLAKWLWGKLQAEYGFRPPD